MGFSTIAVPDVSAVSSRIVHVCDTRTGGVLTVTLHPTHPTTE
jgi:hypothetical protein